MADIKLVIAGSRKATDPKHLVDGLLGFFSAFGLTVKDIEEIVCGGAKGADALGEMWAKAAKITIKYFIPNWKLGRGAGMMRNADMAKYGNALLLLWDGESKGSANMLKNAREQGLKIYVYRIDNPDLSEIFDPAPLF